MFASEATSTDCAEILKSNSMRAPRKKIALFLHVGKAGGGTVREIIDSNNISDAFAVWHPSGVLTGSVSNAYNHILINVRDPVRRAVSAINWEFQVIFRQTCSHLRKSVGGDANKADKIYCATITEAIQNFSGNANIIAEALGGHMGDEKRAEAEHLLKLCTHSKMSYADHVGGVENIRAMARGNVEIYVIVLGPGYTEQATYQINRIVRAVGLSPCEDFESNATTKKKWTHPTGSNYTGMSEKAIDALAVYYSNDYPVISFLASIGCGESFDCMRNAFGIVQDWFMRLSRR